MGAFFRRRSEICSIATFSYLPHFSSTDGTDTFYIHAFQQILEALSPSLKRETIIIKFMEYLHKEVIKHIYFLTNLW